MSNCRLTWKRIQFTCTTTTDALGRITQQQAPDGSITLLTYNGSGLLDSVSVKHAGARDTQLYIKAIDYNEKGHRKRIIYGNDVVTRFHYDKETFRLKRLETRRKNNDLLQDWYYTYDPAGNITHIENKAIPETFFDNKQIAGVATYTYDALYRLLTATGRENNAAVDFNGSDNWQDAAFMQAINPGDPSSHAQAIPSSFSMMQLAISSPCNTRRKAITGRELTSIKTTTG